MTPLNTLQQQTTNMVTKHIVAELSLIKRGHKRLFHPNSGFRMRTGEKIGKISTILYYGIIEQIFSKTYLLSNLPQLPHLRLSGLLICHGKSYQNLSHESITQIKAVIEPSPFLTASHLQADKTYHFLEPRKPGSLFTMLPYTKNRYRISHRNITGLSRRLTTPRTRIFLDNLEQKK